MQYFILLRFVDLEFLRFRKHTFLIWKFFRCRPYTFSDIRFLLPGSTLFTYSHKMFQNMICTHLETICGTFSKRIFIHILLKFNILVKKWALIIESNKLILIFPHFFVVFTNIFSNLSLDFVVLIFNYFKIGLIKSGCKSVRHFFFIVQKRRKRFFDWALKW